MTRLWTPNRPSFCMAPYGALVGACRPRGQQPAASSSLLNSLVAYWKLEEASGTRVDATGRGNDLTDNNTVGQAAGKVGNAASFVRANSEYLSILDNADLSMGDIDFTVAAWVYLATKTPGQRGLVTKWLNDNNFEYALYYLGGATDRFDFSTTSDGTAGTLVDGLANTPGSPSINEWYFVVGWHNAAENTANIQVNNGVVDSVARNGGVFDGTAPFYIGMDQESAYMDGLIDEVGIWKRVLTAAERTALYNGGAGRTYPFTGA